MDAAPRRADRHAALGFVLSFGPLVGALVGVGLDWAVRATWDPVGDVPPWMYRDQRLRYVEPAVVAFMALTAVSALVLGASGLRSRDRKMEAVAALVVVPASIVVLILSAAGDL